tara:strand:- start:449 stop:796 length:348 start_codon:yes stop_codon:yes gene_type:complete
MDLWRMLQIVEKEFNCKIVTVLDIQSLQEDLSYWSQFDKDDNHEDYIDLDSVPTALWERAMEVAYDCDCDCNDYNTLVDIVGEYIIDHFSEYKLEKGVPSDNSAKPMQLDMNLHN